MEVLSCGPAVCRSGRKRPREANSFGLPTGSKVRKLLRDAFKRQRERVLGQLGGRKDFDGVIPIEWDELAPGAEELAELTTPELRAIWEASAESQSGQLNRIKIEAGLAADPEDWAVTDPHLEEAIRSQALAFSEETNRTTSRQLDDALAKLREEMHAGVSAGEAGAKLRRRVEAIFDLAEKWRADRIARTEAMRGYHAAAQLSNVRSGVVVGKRWLASSDACPLCLAIASKSRIVRLDGIFARVGNHPVYADIPYPPAHPHCACTVAAVIDPKLTGEGPIPFAQPLIQPTAEDLAPFAGAA